MDDRYPDDWNSRRKEVYQKDNYTCQNCGVKGGPNGNAELHAHHTVPVSEGGSHSLDNLQTLCSYCHNSIHEGGIVSPKVSYGSWKVHLILLIFTVGIGNLIYAPYCVYKSLGDKFSAWYRLKKAKYGSPIIHIILLFTTVGIGNVIYYGYLRSKRG